MGISFWQVAIVALVVVLLFGGGKISGLMGDFAKGINAFKKGLKDDEESPETIEAKASTVVNKSEDKTSTS